MSTNRIAFLSAALGAALFIFGGLTRAADGNFLIYFQNSKLIVKTETFSRTTYLPLTEIIELLGLPYTDSVALETLTIRSGNSRLVVTKNSALISLNGQIVLLPSPILRENNRWLGPIEFLTQGVARITGTEFRYRPNASRLFAGTVAALELEMNAQSLGPITRLTIRCAEPIELELRRDEQNNRAILAIDRSPVDPVRETLDHKDALVRSIAFDDSDGDPKIVMDLTRDAGNIRVTSQDNNRIFFVDLLKRGEPITAAPPVPAGPVAKADSVQPERKVRVVVIDPGHGGTDIGVKNTTVTEKDLALVLARKLKTALQTRLGVTVLLTRDSDTPMDNEARSAVANNNQANLFISLHAGYSSGKLESASSVFVMKEDFGDNLAPASAPRDQLFLPWYLGYRTSRQTSGQAAKILQEELMKAIPGGQFPIRTAPLAVLSSATMPALLFEIGNLNNPVNAQTLVDAGFQSKLVSAIADAVERFSNTPPAAAN